MRIKYIDNIRWITGIYGVGFFIGYFVLSHKKVMGNLYLSLSANSYIGMVYYLGIS